jgi:glutaminase
MTKIFDDQLIVPDFKSFTDEIERIYLKCKRNKGGKNASYIPQLAHANPNSWGVAVCTIDGQRFTIGDVHTPLTIQSCSKPLTYAVALQNLSANVVHK